MTTMILEVYDAFISAGADEQHSRKAAEALTQADTRLASVANDVSLMKVDVSAIKSDVLALKSDVSALKPDVGKLKTDTILLRWMVGVVLTLVLAIFLKSFVH